MTRAGHLLAVVIAAAAASGCTKPRAPHELRLGHDQSEGHPYDLGARRFAEGVAAETGGVVQIRIFPSGQLGDSPEQFEGLRLGTQDLALAAFSHASQFCHGFGLFGVPFLFENEAHFAAVFDGDVGAELDARCRERYRVGLLSTFSSGYRVLFNGRRLVRTVGDLQGLKIRVMAGEADARTWQVFGAIPSPMPYSEVYSALQFGVIDGAENEPVSILTNRFYETAEYFALTNHLVLPMGLFVSERTAARLPPEYLDVVVREARAAAAYQRELIARRNAEALDEMQREYGVVVSGLKAEDLRERGLTVQDDLARKLGEEELLRKVRSAAGGS